MPILKRRYRRRSPLTYLQLLWLLDDLQIPDAFPDPDTAILRDAWRGIEAELLPAWIQSLPGTRPWAWWQFSAPRPRREYEGELIYLDAEKMITADERRLLDTIPEERRPFLRFDSRAWLDDCTHGGVE